MQEKTSSALYTGGQHKLSQRDPNQGISPHICHCSKLNSFVHFSIGRTRRSYLPTRVHQCIFRSPKRFHNIFQHNQKDFRNSHKRSNNAPKSITNRPTIDHAPTKEPAHLNNTSTKHRPANDQKSINNRPKIDQGMPSCLLFLCTLVQLL